MNMDVREKLVELVNDVLMYLPWGEIQKDTAERIVDRMLDHDVTVQEWISVDDDLPKKITNKVIVLCKNGYIGYGHYENYMGDQTWYNLESGKPFTYWDLEDLESYEVTHWMPMPEPPKGE